MSESKYFRQLGELVLTHPERFGWSLQGFGMLRFYVTQDLRFHLWDSRLRVPGVTDVHTHPWNFVSTVLWGAVRQRRYLEYHDPPPQPGWLGSGDLRPYDRYALKPGANAFLRDEGTRVWLEPQDQETYLAGRTYRQRHDEIHRSYPADGTLTVVHRELAGDPELASTYVPAGATWVDAAPREASTEEVQAACARALSGWGWERP